MTTKPSFDTLLGLTSYTYSMAIRLLPEPLRSDITLSYLLLRLADTLEDSETWTAAERVNALTDLGRLLRHTTSPWAGPGPGPWVSAKPTDDAGCSKLIDSVPELLAALRDCPAPVRNAIVHRVGATIDGMIWFQLRAGQPTDIEIHDLQDLRVYSYFVAGIVMELLTDLFVYRLSLPIEAVPTLMRQSVSFGEGFQLVNILKDVPDDEKSGRAFLPPNVDARVITTLARADFDEAEAYMEILKRAGASRRVVAFLWFIVKLARRQIQSVESGGYGSKMPSEEVSETLATAEELCASAAE